jgi:hypothetical protein
LKRENSWVSLSAESFGGGLDDTSPPSSYPSSREGSSQVLTTALASDDGLTDRRRASLPAPPPDSQRRFDSLPRTPSLLSITRPSRSRTSSPSSYPLLPKKAPSSWPEAMDFQDVLAKKSAAERALAYAAKIRELASEETGLTDWLALNARKGTFHPFSSYDFSVQLMSSSQSVVRLPLRLWFRPLLPHHESLPNTLDTSRGVLWLRKSRFLFAPIRILPQISPYDPLQTCLRPHHPRPLYPTLLLLTALEFESVRRAASPPTLQVVAWHLLPVLQDLLAVASLLPLVARLV